MGRKPLRNQTESVYTSFGLTTAEVFDCDICDRVSEPHFYDSAFSLIGYAVPITDHCPVTGVIGVCTECLVRFRTTDFEKGTEVLSPEVFAGEPYRVGYFLDEEMTWSPPPMTRPIKGVGIYVLRRGFSDDDRIGHCVARTWRHIPPDAQRALAKHWKAPRVDYPGLCKGALRVEALPNWPGRGKAIGVCSNDGHAIRLHSPTVTAMPDEVLMTLIAHELAHAYQRATNRKMAAKGSVEEDAIGIMGEWGFRNDEIHDWWREEVSRRCDLRREKEERKRSK